MKAVARPALVLAGSLGATPDMWALQLPHWQARFDVHIFPWPGHGAPVIPDATNVTALARLLLGWADERALDRFRFVGLSLGGMVGLELGRVAGDRIDRMVVANCRYAQVDATRALWNSRISQVSTRGMESIAPTTLASWLTSQTIARHPERADRVRAMLSSVDPVGYAACALAVRDLDATDTLAHVNVACLALSGGCDVAAPTAIMKQMSLLMPACQHVELPDCSHLSSFDAPEAFGQTVEAFLSLS